MRGVLHLRQGLQHRRACDNSPGLVAACVKGYHLFCSGEDAAHSPLPGAWKDVGLLWYSARLTACIGCTHQGSCVHICKSLRLTAARHTEEHQPASSLVFTQLPEIHRGYMLVDTIRCHHLRASIFPLTSWWRTFQRQAHHGEVEMDKVLLGISWSLEAARLQTWHQGDLCSMQRRTRIHQKRRWRRESKIQIKSIIQVFEDRKWQASCSANNAPNLLHNVTCTHSCDSNNLTDQREKATKLGLVSNERRRWGQW